MGLFDWLRKLISGDSPRRPPTARPAAPGTRHRPVSAESLRTTRPAATGRAPEPPAAPTRRAAPARSALDAKQFAPLADDEVRRQAGQLQGAWGNAWFGRTDLIPPASDDRTRLIDQALVGHGLLTSAELVEIHAVGEEMEEVHPTLGGTWLHGARAVLADREDRAERKRRKQAEAAERRARHAAEVAARRAGDIIYLGRGVSIGLADRRANVEKLKAAGLPMLATPADVAAALQLSIPQLRWLAFHSEAARVTHYTRFAVPKKSGGMRQLAAPRRHLARGQQWILDEILARVPTHERAHGFVAGRSTVTNAAPHVGQDVVLNADLKDFFPTITFPRVKGIFQQLGYSPAAATVLALLCTDSPRAVLEYEGARLYVATGPRSLPQGACTSPALSNLAARALDGRLGGLCGKLGWNYTRYADDLSFSARGQPARLVGYLLARLRHIVADEGFAVNEAKTRILRPSASQQVTGIVVNARPGVPRALVRRMRAILHRARFEGLEAQNREGHPHFESWVSGMLAYITMVNPDQARPLWAAYARLGGGA